MAKTGDARIPGGAFVWLDEFEREFLEDASSGYLTPLKERLGERILNLAPMLMDGVRAIVFDGFEGDRDVRTRSRRERGSARTASQSGRGAESGGDRQLP